MHYMYKIQNVMRLSERAVLCLAQHITSEMSLSQEITCTGTNKQKTKIQNENEIQYAILSTMSC